MYSVLPPLMMLPLYVPLEASRNKENVAFL